MRLGLEAGEATLEAAVELGVTGVPIDGGALVERGIDATLTPLRTRGLEVCQIGAFGFNPLSTDRDEVDVQTQLLRDLIPKAGETGGRFIVLGPGNYHPSGFGHYDPRNFETSARHAYADALRPMLDLADRHDVYLTIEPYLKGVVNGAEAFDEIRERADSDRLRCNLDPSSLYAGLHDFLDPGPLVTRTVDGLRGHIGLIHIKELAVQEGFHLKMGLAPLAAGHTDWAAMLTAASRHVSEDAWVIVEHCASIDEARQHVAAIREAARAAGISLS